MSITSIIDRHGELVTFHRQSHTETRSGARATSYVADTRTYNGWLQELTADKQALHATRELVGTHILYLYEDPGQLHDGDRVVRADGTVMSVTSSAVNRAGMGRLYEVLVDTGE